MVKERSSDKMSLICVGVLRAHEHTTCFHRRTSVPGREDAIEENVSAVVPDSVELGIDMEQSGSEVEGLLPIVTVFLLRRRMI